MPSVPSRSSSRSASPTPTLVDPPTPTRRSRNANLYLDKNSLKSPRKSSSVSSSPASSHFRIDAAHARSPTSSIASTHHTRQSIDSIWDFDFEAHWERRQRDDAIRLAELKGTVPYLTFGRYEEELERVRRDEKGRRRVHGFAVEGAGTTSAVSRGPSALGAAESNGTSSSSSSSSETSSIVQLDVNKKRGILGRIDDNRRTLRKVMRKKRFHLLMIALVAFDLVIVMVELIVGQFLPLLPPMFDHSQNSETDALHLSGQPCSRLVASMTKYTNWCV